jgi:two-component system, OmpR family, sensor kinase
VNTRSLKFRLSVWYATWLAVAFVGVAAFVYAGLKHYLERELNELLRRRAERVAEVIQRTERNWDVIRRDVRELFAPEANNRYIRISAGGQELFLSDIPMDKSFRPTEVASAPSTGSRRELGDGSVVFVQTVRIEGANPILIEFGTSRERIERTLREWMAVVLFGLALMIPAAVGGGYLLVRRALQPVDQMIATAERISSRAGEERLPVPNTGDEIQRLSISLNSMVERLQQSLQHAQRFQADASHELRTPLTIIRAELEAIRDKPANDETADLAGSALDEMDRLMCIVEGLFALARLDAGEAQNETVPVDLSEIVSTTADQISLLAQDKNVRITCRADRPVMVRGDSARLKQVAVNLLDNAIKYTPSGGSITVDVSAHDNEAALEVADTGIGIPADALPHVFERFYRADKARSRELGGAGLGLSIVEAICRAHGGKVEVESTEGSGSRVTVRLPLEAGRS